MRARQSRIARELYEVLAAPRAVIPLAHRCRRAVRGILRPGREGHLGSVENPKSNWRGRSTSMVASTW
eukprot:8485696-Pyramimonas_sp.AAC.1